MSARMCLGPIALRGALGPIAGDANDGIIGNRRQIRLTAWNGVRGATMICLACAFENDAQNRVCRSCGSPDLVPKRAAGAGLVPTVRSDDERIAAAEARLAALARQITAVEAERAAIAAALALVRGLPVRTVATAAIEPGRVDRPAILEIGDLRLTFGGRHGTEVERRVPAGTGELRLRRRHDSGRPQVRETIRSDVAVAVFAELTAGAAVVQIAGGPGTGTTTVLEMLACRAAAHGFTDGAIIVADARGPVTDVAQRLANRFFDAENAQRFTQREIRRIFSGITALVLLDRAQLSVAEMTELSEEFPRLKFVIAEATIDPRRPTITLGPLTVDETVIMLEAGYGRPLSGDERTAALAMCAPAGRFPGRVRLVGVAAGELARSFAQLHATLGTSDAVIGALLASLGPAHQRILSILDLVRIPLSAQQIAAIGGGPSPVRLLERLVECELVRVRGPLYAPARDIAALLPDIPEADLMFDRAIEVVCASLESRGSGSALDDQVYPAEPLAGVVFERSGWSTVPRLGIRLAESMARLGAFGAWGRLLNFLSAAAKRCNDLSIRDAIRHEFGVRALVLGDRHKAQLCLQAAIRDREAAGDVVGAAISRAAFTLIDRTALPSPSTPRRFAAARPRSLAAPPASARPNARPPDSPPPDSPPPEASKVAPARVGRAERFPPRILVALALAIFAVALAVGWMWARPSGSSASSTIPVPLAAALTPARPRQLRIDGFSANPLRVAVGGTTRLCYGVTGADLLRIVPSIGPLPRLQACRTIRIDEARHATYSLVAFGDDGRVAVRRLHLDVVASPHATSRPAPSPAASTVAAGPVRLRSPVRVARVAPRARDAIYQFEVSPRVVARGQLASLCVGVGRYARATVTAIGELQPGITRCYRVAPTSTTTYRLHVTLDRSVDVETATVAVLSPPGRHETARRETSQIQRRR